MTQIQRALLIFVVIPSLYSLGFFFWCCYAERMPIFSKRNTRPLASVIRGHMIFLLILVLFTEIAVGSYPSLPNWITERISFRYGSIFQFLCVFAVVMLGFAEKFWIFIEDDSASAKNGLGNH